VRNQSHNFLLVIPALAGSVFSSITRFWKRKMVRQWETPNDTYDKGKLAAEKDGYPE